MYELKVLKNLLSTPIISDVLDELGIKGMLSSDFFPNFEDAKMCGRAKTILVEERKSDEPINGIYNGLKIYETVEEDDIIVVKNGLPHLAYWGELNTNLAIRGKVSGTIVDGVTRDNSATKSIKYPVFAKGRYAKDIKNYGTINKMNVPVEVDGIVIKPGTLIFGDIDGVVIVPKEREDEIIERALEIASSEKQIIKDIVKGESPTKLVEKYGFF